MIDAKIKHVKGFAVLIYITPIQYDLHILRISKSEIDMIKLKVTANRILPHLLDGV